MKLPGWLSKVAKVLGKLTDVLVAGRKAGLWEKQAGPNIPQGLLSQTEAQARNSFAQAVAAGAEMEARRLADYEFIEGKSASAEVVRVSNGMSHGLAIVLGALSFVGAVVVQKVPITLLLENPRAFGLALLAAAWYGLGLYLQRPGQASVHLGSSKELRDEAETKTSLKIVVPINPQGGK
jgi:hypothetical protein